MVFLNFNKVFSFIFSFSLTFIVLDANALFQGDLLKQCLQDVKRKSLMEQSLHKEFELKQAEQELESAGYLRSIGNWFSNSVLSKEQLQSRVQELRDDVAKLKGKLLALAQPDVLIEVKQQEEEDFATWKNVSNTSVMKLNQSPKASIVIHIKNEQGFYDSMSMDMKTLFDLVIRGSGSVCSVTLPMGVQNACKNLLNDNKYQAFAFYTQKSIPMQNLTHNVGSVLTASSSSNLATNHDNFGRILNNVFSNRSVVVDLTYSSHFKHLTNLKNVSGKQVLSLKHKKQLWVNKLKKIEQAVKSANRAAQQSRKAQSLIANSQKQRSASLGVSLDRFKTISELEQLRALRRKKERIIKHSSNDESVVAGKFIAPFYKSLFARSSGRVLDVQQKIKEDVDTLNETIQDAEFELLQIDNPDIILEYLSDDDSQSVDFLGSNIDNKQLVHTKKNKGKIFLHIKNVNGLYNSIGLNFEQLSTKYNAIFELIKKRRGSRLGFYLRDKQAQSNSLGSSKSRDNFSHLLSLLKQKKLFCIKLCELACKVCLDSAGKAEEPSLLTAAKLTANNKKILKNVNGSKSFEHKAKPQHLTQNESEKPQAESSKKSAQSNKTTAPAKKQQVQVKQPVQQQDKKIVPRKQSKVEQWPTQVRSSFARKIARKRNIQQENDCSADNKSVHFKPKSLSALKQKKVSQQPIKSGAKQTQTASDATSLLQQTGSSQGGNGNSCDASTSNPQNKAPKSFTLLQLFLQQYGSAIIKAIQDRVGVDSGIIAQAKKHVRFFGGMLAAYNRQCELVSDLGDQASNNVLDGQQGIGQAILKRITQNLTTISH